MRSPIFLLFLLVAATAQDGECHAKDGTCRNAACQDYEPLCLQWAEQGKCDIVASSCPWSCEVCQSAEIPRVPEDTSSECLDRHPKCEEWAEAGECVVNPGKAATEINALFSAFQSALTYILFDCSIHAGGVPKVMQRLYRCKKGSRRRVQ
jgi:homoserine dehydrogenase